MTKRQQEIATGYMILAMNRATKFTVEDMRIASDKIARCFEKYSEAQAASQGEYWLSTADPETL